MANEQDYSATQSLINDNDDNANVVVDAAVAAAAASAGSSGDANFDGEQVYTGLISHIIQEIFYSPMNLCLLGIILFLIYKIVRDRTEVPGASTVVQIEQPLPKLRRDFTIKELRAYDGTQADGRVLVAVNGTVYDVTKGKRFYGPGGPYASFAGRDASRNLATFSVAPNDKDEYDDLSDLTAMEMESVVEWELQFKEKYELVGKLLRDNESPNNYDEEEEEEEQDENATENVNDVKKVDSIESIGSAEGLRKRQVNDNATKQSDEKIAENDTKSSVEKATTAAASGTATAAAKDKDAVQFDAQLHTSLSTKSVGEKSSTDC